MDLPASGARSCHCFLNTDTAKHPRKNGDICGHRVQEVVLLQALTERVTLRFNV